MQTQELATGRVDTRQRPAVDKSQTVPAKMMMRPEPIGSHWLRREADNVGRPLSFDSAQARAPADHRMFHDPELRNTIPQRASHFVLTDSAGYAHPDAGMRAAAPSSVYREERGYGQSSVGDEYRRLEQM
eukprot:747861-Hanusia_phi.AAC.1